MLSMLEGSGDLSRAEWTQDLLWSVYDTLEVQQKTIESALEENQRDPLYLRDQRELMEKQWRSLKGEKGTLPEFIQQLEKEEIEDLPKEGRLGVVRILRRGQQERLDWWKQEQKLCEAKKECLEKLEKAGIAQQIPVKGLDTVPQMQMWERYMSRQKAGEKHKKHEQ